MIGGDANGYRNRNRTRAAWQAPDEEGDRQWLDRLGARVLRLLHLRHGGIADLPPDLLSLDGPQGRHHRVARDLRRRLRRPADRRLLPRALGRHPRPQDRTAGVHVPHGFLDDGRRDPADLSTGRLACTCASRHPPPHPGLCGCRGDLRRQFDDSRALSVRPTRLLRQLHASGRTGRARSSLRRCSCRSRTTWTRTRSTRGAGEFRSC